MYVEYSTKLSRDKFEPIFGDLALRTVPCMVPEVLNLYVG